MSFETRSNYYENLMREFYIALKENKSTSSIYTKSTKGLVAKLAPPHVQSVWGLGWKGFELRSKQHVVIISQKKNNNNSESN